MLEEAATEDEDLKAFKGKNLPKYGLNTHFKTLLALIT